MNALRFGPELTSDGVHFRLWTPAARSVDLLLNRPHRMKSENNGWYSLFVAQAEVGTRYRFRVDGEHEVPDPASAFQPDDVTGPSEVVDHSAFSWRAKDWRGRPWEDAAILELHIGTFTPAGTFRAAIDKLDHVAQMGFSAIELMPIADFSGVRNWGYDGVLFYAPDSAYGRPEDLKALIDAAHLHGLMVLLDVVYNHFGPEGNYLGRYAPQFFAKADTPWGSAIDYRVPEVRQFAIQNALHWIEHYRFDGLRLDAVHAISEPGEPHVLEELSRVVGSYAGRNHRAVHLVLENDDNRTTMLDPRIDPPSGRYRAQWNDDYHHAWHVWLTGECHGYYVDYEQAPLQHIARALKSGFAYQGERSEHRHGRKRGEASATLPPTAFINFLQNHDQIGNRPFGNRLTTQVAEQALEAALKVTLLAPMPPLMFMGDEWGSTRPFPFFCDFRGGLGEAVRKGRRQEFKAAYAALAAGLPDPLAEETFRSAVLDWDACRSAAGRQRLELVQRLLLARRQHIAPRLSQTSFGSAQVSGFVICAYWTVAQEGKLILVANLGAECADAPDWPRGVPIWGEAPGASLPPHFVSWSIGAP
jgi:maltooligosyltrehalose trehalohydrolase